MARDYSQELLESTNTLIDDRARTAEEKISKANIDNKRAGLEDVIEDRVRSGESPYFGGSKLRKFGNESVAVLANIGQDLGENVVSPIIYNTIKAVKGPEKDLRDYRLTKFADPSKQTDLTKAIIKTMEEEDIGDKEALELIRKREFLAEDPTRTESTYMGKKVFEAKKFYDNWTDKVGILSAIVPPPRLFGEEQDRAYATSEYVKKYKVEDPEGLAGQITLTVGKLIAGYKFITSLKNPLQASKSYKVLQKELGKTKAAKIKKLADDGKLGKIAKVASKTTTAAGKIAVGGVLLDQIAFDPREPNAADMITALPEEYQKGIVKNFVDLNEYLIDNPEDSEATVRLKSIAATISANAVLGPLFQGFFTTIGALGRKTPEAIKAAKEGVKKARTKEEKIAQEAEAEVDRLNREGYTIDPEASPSSITDELFIPEREYTSIPIKELDDMNINLDKIDDASNLKVYLNEIVEELKARGAKFNEKDRAYKSWDERTKGALNLLEKNPDEAIIKAINDNVLTDELALAVRVLLVGAEKAMTRARNIVLDAQKTRGFVTPQEEALLLEASARFVKVLTATTKATSSAGRVLDSFRQVVGGSKLKKTEALVRVNKDLIESLTGKGGASITDFADMLRKMELGEGGYSSIYKDLGERFNETLLQKVLKRATSYMYAGVLSDPATALVNFVGSGLHQAAELGTRVIAYPIGAAKATAGAVKLFGYEGPKDRVKLGQIFARGAGGVHGFTVGLMNFGRAFLKGDMLSSLKEGDYEIERLARTSGFTPLSIETGTKAGKPFIGLSDQTKEAFGDMANDVSKAAGHFYDAAKDRNIVTGIRGVGDVGRFLIKGIDMGLGALISVPMRTLIGGDAMMKQIAKTSHLYEEAYVQASKKFNPEGKLVNLNTTKQTKDIYEFMKEYISNPNAEAYDRSLHKAAIDTFTNTNILADKIQDVIGKPGSLVHFATRPYIPFVQTVTNLYDRALLYSPLAPFKKEFREDVFKTRGEVGDLAISRMAAGTGLFSMGYLGASGMLQQYSSVAKERDIRITGSGITVNYPFINTRKAAGWHEYSIELTNPETGVRKAFTYNRLDPFAMQVAIGADLFDIITMIQHSKDEMTYYDNLDVLQAAMSATGLSMYKNVIERNPLLQGMEAIGSAFLGTQRGLEGDTTSPGDAALRSLAKPVISIFTNALGRRIDKQGFLGWEQVEEENYTGYLRDTYNLLDNLKYAAHTHASVAGFGKWSREKLNIDKIPFRFNMASGEMILDEIAQNDNFWRQIASITKEHTIEDNEVASLLASLNWSKRRISPDVTLPDGPTIELKGNDDYLWYQKSLSDTFRERVAFYMRTPTYRKYKEQGDNLSIREEIDKIWTRSLKTAKEQVVHKVIFKHNRGVPYEFDQWLQGNDKELYELMRKQRDTSKGPKGGFTQDR